MNYIKKHLKFRNATRVFLIFGSLVCLLNFANAQINIDQSDMPSVGDTVRISTGLNLDFIDYEQTGENFNWDFSQLVPVYQRVDTFQNPWDMALVYKLFFGVFSDFALRAVDNIPIPGFPFSDMYNFYDNSSSAYKSVGLGVSIAGIAVPFKYDNPDVVYDFPMNYQNEWTSQAYFAQGIPSMGYLKMSKSHTDIIDGWGNLTTPYGTFEVLRLKSEVVENDSLYLDSLGFGVPINRNYTVYQWIGKNQKKPLLQITSGLGGIFADYVDSARVIIQGVNDISFIKDNDLKVFPNPLKEIINLEFELPQSKFVEINIFDIKGNIIAKLFEGDLPRGKANMKFYPKDFNMVPANYILQLKSGNSIINRKIIFNP